MALQDIGVIVCNVPPLPKSPPQMTNHACPEGVVYELVALYKGHTMDGLAWIKYDAAYTFRGEVSWVLLPLRYKLPW